MKECTMASIIEITDLNIPELAVYCRLTEAQLRAKQTPEKAVFIAEGLTVIGHALDAGLKPISFLMERRHIEGKARGTILRCPDTPIYTADRAVLAELTGFELTRGVLCAMKRPDAIKIELILNGAKRIAVLENIVDPTNVGAIIRSAAALNIDGILLSPSCCDPLNRRSVRVSMGTVFQLPWARLPENSWPHSGTEMLHRMGFKTVALALSDDAIPIDDPRLCAEEKLAILLGSEGDGLSRKTIATCDYCAIIPMAHGVDSLNVAAASAVAFWQLRG